MAACLEGVVDQRAGNVDLGAASARQARDDEALGVRASLGAFLDIDASRASTNASADLIVQLKRKRKWK
jgi:hypothetical protein